MRAWLLNDFTGLDALHVSESVPRPSPGPDEVLIRVHFAALNPADRFLAENLYPARPKLPHILGRDGGGVVEEIGAGVSQPRVGDRVVVLRSEAGVEKPGTFAEYLVVPAEYVVPKPAEWTEQEAAAAPLVYLTAHQALTQWGGPQKRETVLITGASGGVGVATLHLARALGHRTIALSRSEPKRAKLTNLGADLVLHPNDPELKARVKEFTERKGVDLVVDNVGGELFNTILDLMGYGGRISVVGGLDGPVPVFNTAKLLFRRTRVGGVLVFDYKAPQARAVWHEILDGMRRIGARPLVDSVFPFEKLKEAFARLASGPMGKVLLDIRT